MNRAAPENWGKELARFCRFYRMTPDEFFDLTWAQYDVLGAAIIDEDRNGEAGGPI
jgi:hypothetical protein